MKLFLTTILLSVIFYGPIPYGHRSSGKVMCQYSYVEQNTNVTFQSDPQLIKVFDYGHCWTQPKI